MQINPVQWLNTSTDVHLICVMIFKSLNIHTAGLQSILQSNFIAVYFLLLLIVTKYMLLFRT